MFDLDGTLYNSAKLGRRLVAAAPLDCLLMRNERIVRAELKGCDFSSPDAFYGEFFLRIARRSRRSEPQIRDWYFSRYMPLMLKVLEKQYTLYPGAEELVRTLQDSGIGCAVYSDYPNTPGRLRALGFNTETCGSLYGPDDFGALKPAERPFREIAASLGASCDKTLVIGDRDDTDGAGARSAGMGFIRIESGKKRSAKNTGDTPYPWFTIRTILMDHAETLKNLDLRKPNPPRPTAV
nr:HAD family hydrolase [Breznakiella homolactica]